jgi:hypothetical protein
VSGKSELEVLNALSHVEWRRVLRICDLIEEARKARKASLGRKSSIGQVYVDLERLEMASYVESRQAELTAAELALRGGRGAREFRLTPGGIRRRIDLTPLAGAHVVLAPEPA